LTVISAEIQSGTAAIFSKRMRRSSDQSAIRLLDVRALRVLAKGKRLRGTALDIFGKTEERRLVR
jgi:hypothetical protein